MPYQYDLIVIGSGPAGEKGAAQAAYFGKRVALVERADVVGGAGANTGTLPSKTLRETSLYLSGFRQRGLYGVNLALKGNATVRDFLYRERRVKENERARVSANLERHQVDVLTGSASFADPHTIRVSGAGGEPRELTASVILIATGSSPRRPAIFPRSDPRVYDSDEILDLRELPATMAVVGAGVIGCEYACTFAALGTEVTLIDGRGELLSFMDEEITAILRERMAALGITFAMPDAILAIEPGPVNVGVQLRSGRSVKAAAVLIASGRTGNTAELNLEAAGVIVDERGYIAVNERFQTSAPHVFAAGDVIGFPALASTSMEQARIAMVHAFDLRYKTSLAPTLPYGIYTIPELSMAGETERSLRAADIDYIAGRARYANNARGEIIGEKGGLLKLLFRADDMRLLGVHMIGEQATELVHIGLVALLAGASADLFIHTCFNYPTLSETYKYATYDAMGERARRLAAEPPPA